MKRVVFRVDHGLVMGLGHIMRCLSIAKYLLHEYNCQPSFVCKNHEGNIAKRVKESFPIYLLDVTEQANLEIDTWLGTSWQDDAQSTLDIIGKDRAEILIVDHYGVDYKWQNYVKDRMELKVVVIDDLFNRKHNCDILIDQCYYIKDPYKDLVPTNCEVLLGFQYIILNPQFLQLEPKPISKEIRRINICIGGTDKPNLTEKIVNILIKNRNKIHNYEKITFDVVVGATNQNYSKLKEKLLLFSNFNLLYDVENMAVVLNKSDLCIGSSGITSYERIYLKLPSLVITLAPNQMNIATTLHELGLFNYLGHYNSFQESDLISGLNNFISHPGELEKIYNNLTGIIDGQGIERIIKKIMD